MFCRALFRCLICDNALVRSGGTRWPTGTLLVSVPGHQCEDAGLTDAFEDRWTVFLLEEAMALRIEGRVWQLSRRIIDAGDVAGSSWLSGRS